MSETTEPTVSPFLSEVLEQPAALAALVRHYRGAGSEVLETWARQARARGRVRFAGMGTSGYAPLSVAAALADLGLDVDVEDAGELLHYPRPFPGQLTLVSQSGESAETRGLAESWPRRDDLAALTNVPTSRLGRAASIVLPLVAGHETAITSKTYVNTLALLHLMVAAVAGAGSVGRALDRLEGIVAAPEPAEIERAAALLARGPHVLCIARGPALATARQFALTLMEGAGLSAMALTGGAFRHGPLELAGPGLAAVFFIAAGRTSGLVERMAVETTRAGSRTVVVTDREGRIEGVDAVVHVAAAGEELFPIACAAAHAQLVETLARRLGRQAGVFVRCRKVTDVE